MNIAKVIVDVPALNVDQTFDYQIPNKFISSLQAGMRVLVPFGRRRVMGYVIEITDETTFDSLRSILDVLDIDAVLTNELLDLGKWLAKETLCFQVTAYAAMLPQALKSTYEKEYELLQKEDVDERIRALFGERATISQKEIENAHVPLSLIQKMVKEQKIDVRYLVKERARIKKVTMVQPSFSSEELNDFIVELPANATKQREIVEYFIENNESISLPLLKSKLQAGDSTIKSLIAKNVLQTYKKEIQRNPYENRVFQEEKRHQLTMEQNEALQPIYDAMANQVDETFLLHGITGSGKTEIYLRAIEQVVRQGQEAIVLVPEIALTPQMVTRFKGRFGKKVAVLHSALSIGEKYDEWRKIQRGQVQVVVGARSAIFAPFENLGIIIIDEEHEATYKQEDQPRYHARDVALKRASYHRCPTVLGSATPTLESFARAKKGVYTLLQLTKRTNEKPLPRVEIVDMREELHAGNRSMFSRVLFEQMKERLIRKEQIVLLLNRRGFATFIMCRDCGYVDECPNCDISLTFHKNDNQLKCHYCMYTKDVPTTCIECDSDAIRHFGTGTQQVEELLAKLLPEARVIRMDVDTTRRKGSHERLLDRFRDGEADILLGTQMIAKGLDFEKVTLVGVLTADSMLHLPDFRASERTFQLLTQVSGRAGRHDLDGEVFVQTYTPEHYSIQLASRYDYEQLFQKEMQTRRTFHYPPYVYLVLINISHPNQVKTIQVAQTIAQILRKEVGDRTIILGPTPSPIARINNRYRYQIMIKHKREPLLLNIIKRALYVFQDDQIKDDLQIKVDTEPYHFM